MPPQFYLQTPDGCEPPLNITNLCQGATPLHLAVSTGQADIVIALGQRGANFKIVDRSMPFPRGPYHLAKNLPGEKKKLADWIANNTDFVETIGWGRPHAEKTKGCFAQKFRNDTKPLGVKGTQPKHGYKPPSGGTWNFPKSSSAGKWKSSSSQAQETRWDHTESRQRRENCPPWRA